MLTKQHKYEIRKIMKILTRGLREDMTRYIEQYYIEKEKKKPFKDYIQDFLSNYSKFINMLKVEEVGEESVINKTKARTS